MNPQLLMMLAQMGQQIQGNAQQAGFQFGAGGDPYGALSNIGGMIPGPMGQLASIGGSFLSGRKAKKEKKKLRKQIEKSRRATESIFGKGLSQQEALSRQATQQRLGGFDQAKQAAQLSAQSAKRTALERGQQQQASLAQGLANRGLGSTTVGSNLGRGVNADTTRQLGGIDEALGNYFGQLAMGRAGIEAQGTESLADLAGQRTNFDVQNAQFWSPYHWNRLGQVEQRIGAGGGFGGGGGMGQLDLSSIFGG